MPDERNTASAMSDHWDERFNHGFDPTTLPAVVERLRRICGAVLREAPEFEMARAIGDTAWLSAEAEPMARLLQEAMQERLGDLDRPQPATGSC